MSQKRKALESRNVVIDKDSVAQYAKKARTWCESIVSQGLNSLWNGLGLKPLEELGTMKTEHSNNDSLYIALEHFLMTLGSAKKANGAQITFLMKATTDESTALNRLTSRYASASAVSQYKRADYVAAVNQSMGVSETDNVGSSVTPRTDVNARSSTVPFYDDRFRKYGRLQNLFDEQQSDQENKPPAWTRTRKQTPRWQINLDRFRSLIAKNLPSINKQDLSPAHQAAVDKHEEIERELEKRKGRKHFRPISDDDRQKINQALSDGYGPVAEGFNVTITKNDIRTLRPGEWLNDEVINFYGNLIMARSNTSNTLPKVHVFSTFFYKTLSENGYDKVRRWTKKTNIFEKDYILIPIHCSGNHWTSAVIDMTKKKISYYDSLLGNNPKCFLTLRAYLEKESLDKLKKPFDFQGWENECPKNIPQQRNGYDCGVFTCFFIEFKSRGEDTFDFSQADMPYLRQKMVLDIVNKVLAE
ncbi:SUMO1 sentrin specific peptidase 1 [Actinomortierella wolfii]|nr:SUMO1 sentrin specific peptidase 1 [Actinomortierella wolfii]